MTMLQAVNKCLRKYGTFSGRASRSEYWWFILFAFLFEWPYFLTILPSSLTIPFTHINITLFGETDPINHFLQYFYFTASLFLFIPQISVGVRRLHDTNKSLRYWFFILLPVIGWFLVLRRLCKKGDRKANKYGEPDNSPKVSKRKHNEDSHLDDEDEVNESEQTIESEVPTRG